MTKFLLTPNGVLWGLKQPLLQNMNQERNKKFNVIKDLPSFAPTIHTERHKGYIFNPPLVIPETPEQLTESDGI